MHRSSPGSPKPFDPGLPVPDEQTQALAALVARRRQLIEMLTAEKNRLRLAAQPIQKRLRAHITWLEKELASTNTDLEATIRLSPVWREKEEVLRSVPGWDRSWSRHSSRTCQNSARSHGKKSPR